MWKIESIYIITTFVAIKSIVAQKLEGAGASFPAPLYQEWFNDFSQQNGIEVSYEATGSSSGVRKFESGEVDFGASDNAVSDDKLATLIRPVIQIPITGGAIAIAYNKPDCDLELTQVELARVAYGSITDWSELGCDSGPISWVHRSDGSGTTAGFTESLSAFYPFWAVRVGKGKTVSWPGSNAIGAVGNSGIADVISSTPGAIGYLNYGYVKQADLQQATIQNRAGNFVVANAETSTEALSKISLDSKLRGSDPNPAGENAFPIVSLTWLLVEPGYKSREMKSLLSYMLSKEAQRKSDELGYVPLPESILQNSLAAVDSL